jgi:hypothetical protein
MMQTFHVFCGGARQETMESGAERSEEQGCKQQFGPAGTGLWAVGEILRPLHDNRVEEKGKQYGSKRLTSQN